MFLATLIVSQFLFVASEVAVQSPQDADKEGNGAIAKIYMYSDDAWKTTGSSALAQAMADNANKHCNLSHSDCCLLKNWTTSSTRFTASDFVDDFNGYPTSKRPYTTVKMGMQIPSGLSSFMDTSCANHTYIKKGTVIKLVEASRDTFSDKTNHYITEIEDKRHSLPPNNLINYIMIPIAVALVLILVILLVVLMWRCGKGDHTTTHPRPLEKQSEEKYLMKESPSANYNTGNQLNNSDGANLE